MLPFFYLHQIDIESLFELILFCLSLRESRFFVMVVVIVENVDNFLCKSSVSFTLNELKIILYLSFKSKLVFADDIFSKLNFRKSDSVNKTACP